MPCFTSTVFLFYHFSISSVTDWLTDCGRQYKDAAQQTEARRATRQNHGRHETTSEDGWGGLWGVITHSAAKWTAMTTFRTWVFEEKHALSLLETDWNFWDVSSRKNVLYTVNHKKRDILFLTIILGNLNRFLQFLYHFNREEILHATVVKFTTSP